MGDDIGWMQPGIYHEGLRAGETPNIDRIGHEGAKYMEYYAMQSCTSGRNAFVTGMYPLRTGMIEPQLPGSPSYLLPGTPSIGMNHCCRPRLPGIEHLESKSVSREEPTNIVPETAISLVTGQAALPSFRLHCVRQRPGRRGPAGTGRIVRQSIIQKSIDVIKAECVNHRIYDDIGQGRGYHIAGL
jgi:Sulfatase